MINICGVLIKTPAVSLRTKLHWNQREKFGNFIFLVLHSFANRIFIKFDARKVLLVNFIQKGEASA